MSSKSKSKKCSKGQIRRKGYTTKKGTKVKSSCIIAQSGTGKKNSKAVKKYLKSKSKIYKMARQKFPKASKQKCSKGKILKVGYSIKRISKSGKKTEHWVKPSCIKSTTGKSSKGKKLITILHKGSLEKYGYKDIKNLSIKQRHRALTKAINHIKPMSVFRKIMALAIFNKNTDPKFHNLLVKDADWIKTQPQYKEGRKKSKSKSKKLRASKKKSKSKNKKTVFTF